MKDENRSAPPQSPLTLNNLILRSDPADIQHETSNAKRSYREASSVRRTPTLTQS